MPSPTSVPTLAASVLAEAAKVPGSSDVVRVLDGPRALGEASAFAILARGDAVTLSPILEVVFFRSAIEARVELPTSGLFAPRWRDAPRVAGASPDIRFDVRAEDVDGDAHPYVVVRASFRTEPRRGAATVSVEQLFVVSVDPVARISASVQLRYEPDERALGSRRADAAFQGQDLVVRGDECGAHLRKGDDAGGLCTPLVETYRFDPEARSWLRGLTPQRVPANCCRRRAGPW